MPDIASAYPSSLPLSGGTVTGNLTVDGTLSAGSSPGGSLPVLVATTGESGFALQNGTPTIISWTAPNDGNLHRVQLFFLVDVTSTQTGGAVQAQPISPLGDTAFIVVFAGGASSGTSHGPANATTFTIGPNTTFSLVQSSAQSAGAAKVFAEIWAS